MNKNNEFVKSSINMRFPEMLIVLSYLLFDLIGYSSPNFFTSFECNDNYIF